MVFETTEQPVLREIGPWGAIGSWVKQLGLSWNGLGKNRERFTSLVIRSGSVGFVRSPNIFGSVPRSFILGGKFPQHWTCLVYFFCKGSRTSSKSAPAAKRYTHPL